MEEENFFACPSKKITSDACDLERDPLPWPLVGKKRRVHIVDSFEYTGIHCRAHSVSIEDFGGVGDGKTSNTRAFHDAIVHLARFSYRGGGLLYVPAGRWLTGNFNLTSHFTLYLAEDAVVLASKDVYDCPLAKPLPSYGHGREAPCGRYASFIFGTNLTDIIITGGGWNDRRPRRDLVEEVPWREAEVHTRPHLVEVMHSTSVQISNLTLLNSPFWTLHPVYSSNIVIQGLRILAPIKSPNTDGIPPVRQD